MAGGLKLLHMIFFLEIKFYVVGSNFCIWRTLNVITCLFQEPNSPRAVCRFREAVLPYYRFKEEILSVSPFASVIYDFISDAEADHMKDFVRNKVGELN